MGKLGDFWGNLEKAAVFLGEYSHTLDREFRVALPARLREAAGEGLSAGLCLVRGAEPCIVAYPRDRFERLVTGLEADNSIGKTVAREFKRALGGSSIVVVPDSQGRLLLPEFLRAHAHIQKDVTLVGAINKIEIWDTATFQSREPARHAAFERLAPLLFE